MDRHAIVLHICTLHYDSDMIYSVLPSLWEGKHSFRPGNGGTLGHTFTVCGAMLSTLQTSSAEFRVFHGQLPVYFCTHDVMNFAVHMTCSLSLPAPYLIQLHVFTTNESHIKCFLSHFGKTLPGTMVYQKWTISKDSQNRGMKPCKVLHVATTS